MSCDGDFLEQRMVHEEWNKVLEDLDGGHEFVESGLVRARSVQLLNSIKVFESNTSKLDLGFESVFRRHWITKRVVSEDGDKNNFIRS